MADIYPGNVVKVSVLFVDHETQTPTDPTAIRFTLLQPGQRPGQGTTYTYGGQMDTVCAQIVRTGTGAYRADVVIPPQGAVIGKWGVAWEGDGTVGMLQAVVGSGESFFIVQKNSVRAP